MNPNLLDPMVRKQILEDIKSWENVQRKLKSLKAFEIINGRIDDYVYSELCNQLGEQTAKSMPRVSTLNVADRVVSKESSIYTDEPERKYSDIQKGDEETLKKIYAECGFNSGLQKTNKYYKYRAQTFLEVRPKHNKLKLRVLHGHNIDVIPDVDDPEMAFAYIVSAFDKSQALKSDGRNQITADGDDYRKSLERYKIYTTELWLIMDGNGTMLDSGPNEIEEHTIIDVSKEKDFEFFVQSGQTLDEFTVAFNVAWSDLMHIMRMQGFSIGVISGDPDLKPEYWNIGPNKSIFLPKNLETGQGLEFDFKSPTPNIEASLKVIESLVATFMTTRGIDSSAITSNNSGAKTYSSAIERLLAMIDQFRASKEDFDLFTVVEKKLHTIVTKLLAVYSGTQFLDDEFRVTAGIINSKLDITFHKPEMIETMSEQLDNAQKKVNLGIADQVTVLMDLDGLEEQEAIEKVESIQERQTARLKKMAEENPELAGEVEDVEAETQAQ